MPASLLSLSNKPDAPPGPTDIKANQGRVWLESGEGEGTTFYVAMPAA